MLFQTVIGNENWANGQTKLHLFVCPTHMHKLGDGKEAHLWMVSKRGVLGGNPRIETIGSPQVISSGTGMKPEIVGKWTTCVYDVAERTLIKTSITRSGQSGMQSASLLFHFREHAALRRVTIATLPNNRASLSQLVLEGRFDLIDVGDAEGLGYDPPAMYRPSYMQSRWSRMNHITVTEVQPEITPVARVVKTVVENQAGEKVTVTASHRRRALDL